MAAYVLGIAGAVLITAIFTMISPEGKMGKFVRGAMKLFTVVILVSPFISAFGKTGLPFAADKIDEDEGYYAAVSEKLARADEEEIIRLIEEEYGIDAAVSVQRSMSPAFPREKIRVKLSEEGIFGQGAHKDITDRVQAFLEEKYGCQAEVVS